jgi:PAS domain S-box-containing protein
MVHNQGIMDSAVPAHEIAEALCRPRDSRRETSPLPSLILRLEHLPEATARHERARSLGAGLREEQDDLSSPELPTATPEAAAVVDDAAAPAPLAPAPPVLDRLPRPSNGTARRVVDVAAPERLTVATPLTRWSAAVAASHDACFVLDTNGILISVSVAATELLGCGELSVIGRHILDVITLVDLDSGGPDPDYAHRITALAVLESPGLSRSLMRVRHDDASLVTLDTTSAPVHDVTGYPLGSVTFLAPIPRR